MTRHMHKTKFSRQLIIHTCMRELKSSRNSQKTMYIMQLTILNNGKDNTITLCILCMSYVSQDSNETHPKCISNSSKFPTVEYFMNGAIFILKYLVTMSQCDIFFYYFFFLYCVHLYFFL
jgi:hypothetical protein